MQTISGGVCAPQGFRAGGIRCGIKASAQKRDLALIVSDRPCVSAALFTTNRVKAASILVSQERLAARRCRGVIANSGNANACTGEAGLETARRMADLAAERLGLRPEEIAVASTGVIGTPLPFAPIAAGMAELAASLRSGEEGHDAALEAIMTTDTRKKGGALEVALEGIPIRIGAMVKGSGMIHPNMATMLGFITTDAAVEAEALDRALRRAVRGSFNRVSVDGDTSTNDMILIMANGAAGNPLIQLGEPGFERFTQALETLCAGLARSMARDGEGASRLMTVRVQGAADEEAAELLAKSVASSSLVKAACFGADANWGRILCALGYSGAAFDPAGVSVRFASAAGEVLVCAGGEAVPFSEERAKAILSQEEVEIRIDLARPQEAGPGGSAAVWGCDLTYDYVRINGDYRS